MGNIADVKQYIFCSLLWKYFFPAGWVLLHCSCNGFLYKIYNNDSKEIFKLMQAELLIADLSENSGNCLQC